MRPIKHFVFLASLFFMVFSVPPESFSKPLLYGESEEDGVPVNDPICMVTVLSQRSFCSMNQQAPTGSQCICRNQLRSFSGFVVTRQEFTLLCESRPLGSCSDLPPLPETSDKSADELSASKGDDPTSSDPSAPDEPSEKIDAGFSVETASKPILLTPLKPDQREIDYDELLRRHPLRKFKKPNLLDVFRRDEKN